MLPICFGDATKLSAYLLDADKHYWVRLKLGETTATADAEGEIIQTRPVGELSRTRIEEVLMQFRGEIEQLDFVRYARGGQPMLIRTYF